MRDWPAIELHGRTAVVTGGGSGIGRGLALTWAAEGMNVVVADVDGDAATRVAAEVGQIGGRGSAVQCDVTDPVSVTALAEAVDSEFGDVAILCNNAGVIVSRRLLECDRRDWQWLLAVNLLGIVNCVDAFVPKMVDRGRPARIVNTASDVGVVGRYDESALPLARRGAPYGLYTVSKHAVVSYSEQLEAALAETAVSVSVLCPSAVRTRIADSERSRPSQAGEPASQQDAADDLAQRLAEGMDPLEVGAIVKRAVHERWFYIFTEDLRGQVLHRASQMIGDLDRLASATSADGPSSR